MKKSLLALAVLGAFAGAASAQSSVTLYGIVDVGYSYIDHERDGISSISGIDAGIQSGNRLGFRGSEALGRGLNAIFQIEAGFNLDTGASGQSSAAAPGFPGTGVSNRLFGRIALAGLQGDFGTLALGRFGTVGSGTGPFDLFGRIDPFGTGFTGAGGLQDTFTELGSLRTDNTIHYQSPKIAGFQGGIGYSFQVDGTEQAGSSNNSRAADAGLSWEGGPFYAAVTYSQIEWATPTPPTPGGFPDQKILQVGGTFDLKFIKLHAAYAKEEGVRNTVIASPFAGTAIPALNGGDADSWMAGVSFPLGAFNLFASYQERDGDAAGGFEADGQTYAIGATYAMSRRTNLYAAWGLREGDASLSEGVAPFAVSDPVNRMRFVVGMRHFF